MFCFGANENRQLLRSLVIKIMMKRQIWRLIWDDRPPMWDIINNYWSTVQDIDHHQCEFYILWKNVKIVGQFVFLSQFPKRSRSLISMLLSEHFFYRLLLISWVKFTHKYFTVYVLQVKCLTKKKGTLMTKWGGSIIYIGICNVHCPYVVHTWLQTTYKQKQNYW